MYDLEVDTLALDVLAVVAGVGPLLRTRGKNGYSTLALSDMPAESLPGVESGDAFGVGALRQDQQRIVPGIAVKTCLNAEILPEHIGGSHLVHSRGEQFQALVDLAAQGPCPVA